MARYSSSQRLNGTPTFSATRMYTSMKAVSPSEKGTTAATPTSNRSVAREQSLRSALQQEEDSDAQGTTGKFRGLVLRNSWQEEEEEQGELVRDRSSRSILLREDSGQGSFKPRASSANVALRTPVSGSGIAAITGAGAASPGRNIVSSRNTGWDVLGPVGSTTLTAEDYELSAGNNSGSDRYGESKEADAQGWDVREAKNSSSRDRGTHSSRNNPGLRQPAARAFARPRTANPAGGSHK
jgi:hypothetical protein